MAGALAIEAGGLRKSFGEVDVLAGVDLQVPQGSVYALLGPNGAGKTTTVRILCTLLRPDAGDARVAGYDVLRQRRAVRARISLTGQEVAVDDLQTGEENLRMVGRLMGLRARPARTRAGELLDQFGLVDAGRRRVGTYSGGMRRKLDLAASLMRRPEVLFLDEPTTGLDPRSRQGVWDAVGDLARAGVTILLTTQYLEEADRLAHRVGVVDGGRIVAEGTPAELKAQVQGQRLDLTTADEAAFEVLVARLGDQAVLRDRDGLVVGLPTDGSAAHVRHVLDDLDPQGRVVARFRVHQASLDDVFFALTGHPTRSDDRESEAAGV
jgi:ABC-2 type transport system ATP-binding protein